MAQGSNAVLHNVVRVLPWYGLALLIVLLDQYTKDLASASLTYARPERVFSWFNLSLHHNTGAAFSFLNDAGGWQRYFFSAIAILVSVILMVWLYRMPGSHRLLALGLGLILGGAVGNLWDRLTLGYVVDFISVHYRNYYFPAFNIADAAISVGAVCMLIDSFFLQDQESTSDDEAKS